MSLISCSDLPSIKAVAKWRLISSRSFSVSASQSRPWFLPSASVVFFGVSSGVGWESTVSGAVEGLFLPASSAFILANLTSLIFCEAVSSLASFASFSKTASSAIDISSYFPSWKSFSSGRALKSTASFSPDSGRDKR